MILTLNFCDNYRREFLTSNSAEYVLWQPPYNIVDVVADSPLIIGEPFNYTIFDDVMVSDIIPLTLDSVSIDYDGYRHTYRYTCSFRKLVKNDFTELTCLPSAPQSDMTYLYYDFRNNNLSYDKPPEKKYDFQIDDGVFI